MFPLVFLGITSSIILVEVSRTYTRICVLLASSKFIWMHVFCWSRSYNLCSYMFPWLIYKISFLLTPYRISSMKFHTHTYMYTSSVGFIKCSYTCLLLCWSYPWSLSVYIHSRMVQDILLIYDHLVPYISSYVVLTEISFLHVCMLSSGLYLPMCVSHCWASNLYLSFCYAPRIYTIVSVVISAYMLSLLWS